MTPQDLIAAFESVAEAPDGVARLRELVLQLAVRGRLVPQDDGDEPATELLQRVAAEKAKLVMEKKIRKPKALPPVSADDVPFDVPDGWAWVRMDDLLQFVTSGSRGWAKYYSDDGPVFLRIGNLDYDTTDLDLANIQRVSPPEGAEGSRTAVAAGDFLISITGDTGMVGLVPDGLGRAFINQHIALCRPLSGVWPAFVARVCTSLLVRDQLWDYQRGIKNSLGLNDIRVLLLPLPPLAEQHRIVARVDELMGLLDRLEAARDSREATRVALRDAALAALRDADSAEEVEVAWQRIAERMDDLFTDPADVEPLRQTVLQLAVRGRLVPQDETEEPASVLLGERALSLDENPPAGWSWSSIRLLGDIRGGGTPSKRESTFWDGDVPWVCPKDMKRDFIGESILSVTPLAVEKSSVKMIPSPALLMVVRGMILAHSFPTALTTGTVTVNQDMKALIPFDTRVAPWLLLASKGLKREFLNLVQRSSHGTCKLRSDELFFMPLPIPPLAEQRRIVARVDELMSMLDRLGETLKRAKTSLGAFAAAAVHHFDA